MTDKIIEVLQKMQDAQTDILLQLAEIRDVQAEIREEQAVFRVQFDLIDNHFKSIYQRFDQLEEKVDTIATGLSDLRTRYSMHERFMGNVMEMMGEDNSRMARLQTEMEQLKDRVPGGQHRT